MGLELSTVTLSCLARLFAASRDGARVDYEALMEHCFDAAGPLELEHGAGNEKEADRGRGGEQELHGSMTIAEIRRRRRQAISLADSQGLTALHMACLRGDKDVVQYLVAQGAALQVRSVEGETPTMLARDDGVRKVLLTGPSVGQSSRGKDILMVLTSFSLISDQSAGITGG
jgi:hypothetical protein